MMKTKAKSLGIFSLALITALSVDSIRNLPATALFGSSLIFFFILGALLFLLPGALVSAELASTSDKHGGVYVWVSNAFGPRAGLVAVWFQWIENVIWYPTILSFVAGSIGYLIAPSLAANKYFLISVILSAFWGATFINLLGIKSSALFSNLCALFGLVIPMLLIIGLGASWLLSGNSLQISLNAHAMLPSFANNGMWVALTGIMLSFCGIEIAAVHMQDVRNPQRDFPRAMLLATVFIVLTLIGGSLAIAMVLPVEQISLVAGIMQAFQAFFAAYHMTWILPLIALMLVIGGIGGVSNWIIAPTRGLQIAFKDQQLLPHLQNNNVQGAPQNLLLYQALIVSVVSMIFLLMPSVNGSYWYLTALAAQLYMIMYLQMFAAAIKLRYCQHNNARGFRIPGGNLGMWLVAGTGLIGSALTFSIGFIPPANIVVGGTWHYEILLILGLVVMSAPPFILSRQVKQAVLKPAGDVRQAES